MSCIKQVWKGILDESSAGGVPSYMVAVKISKEAKGEGADEMMREATVMAQVSGHPNLVSLVVKHFYSFVGPSLR